ncbi:putative ATP-dependent RNA helicase [Sphaerosporella brunnea]|uniref:Putative ATP-dependent RNA helicase n=1 Tax=Sphaerosporella brunnea TaxID=1250544 RepID=A0A5J5EM03_9PEZI|nr:putative ATP-dependent RNA helicase [Sphaerosporella brunnea]
MPPKRKPAPDAAAEPPKKKPARTKKPPPPPSAPAIPWPPHFLSLERVHRALNLVYTFCCTRKQLATTFDNLKAAVEGHTKKPLTISDIAQIKSLVPRTVHFEYVDAEALEVYVAGATEREKAYSMMQETEAAVEEREVLLFEFVDGDLRKSVVNRLGDVKKAPGTEFKLPTFSTKTMKSVIEKRNAKFKEAVDKFLWECEESGQDPVEAITHQHRPYVPAKSFSEEVKEESTSTIPAEIPTERKSIAEIVEEIKKEDIYCDQIVEGGHRVFEPQEAEYGDLDFLMSQELVNAIYTARNITRFYSHQAEAINNLHAGHDVIVSTSTSSGKSLIYQIPVLHALEQDPDTRAMFIFPTKALAQDQKRSLQEVLGYMSEKLGPIVVDTFDGDTPFPDRRRIREEASVIFTNPDMLHVSILPNEEHWRMFLKNLKFVVVDELHVYTGPFGSHVALIMRRLRRICSAVGNNNIRFVSCSATITNPIEHMQNIFGITSVQLTSIDGSPRGRKEYLVWNTPPEPSGDILQESAKLFTHLLLRGVRCIAFCQIRQSCELLLQAVRRELQRRGRPEVISLVMGYRGGYTPQDRRRIEAEMFSGHLLGIVATNALELGVDIGALDAVITVGFPSSLAALRQQSGRAGRRNKDSLSVLIGGTRPLDQHYMSHPEELFSHSPAPLNVDLANPTTLESHLQCAAQELPLHPPRDELYFGPLTGSLTAEKLFLDQTTGFFSPSPRFLPHPASLVPIRDIEDAAFAVVDTTANRNIILETVEPSRAIFLLYEGGIFLHQGRSYLIKTFSHSSRLAAVEAVNVTWTTSPRDYTDIDPLQTLTTKPLPTTTASYGKLKVLTKVFGFFKFDRANRILDAVEVDSPPLEAEADGVWIDLPPELLPTLTSHRINPAAAIHSAAHAILSLLPAGLKTECKAPEKEFAKIQTSRKRPARLVFVERRGGTGAAAIAWERVAEVLETARLRVENCPCEMGCLDCVLGAGCKEGHEVASRVGAGVVLRCVLGMRVQEEWWGRVPEEGERGWDRGTVVPVWR